MTVYEISVLNWSLLVSYNSDMSEKGAPRGFEQSVFNLEGVLTLTVQAQRFVCSGVRPETIVSDFYILMVSHVLIM